MSCKFKLIMSCSHVTESKFEITINNYVLSIIFAYLSELSLVEKDNDTTKRSYQRLKKKRSGLNL